MVHRGALSSGGAHLEALLRASRAVLSHSTFEGSARLIFEEAKLITGATAGYIALLSEDGSENEVLFLDSGGLECTVDPALPMPIRGLRATAYDENRCVFHNDFMNSEWVDFLPGGHAVLHNVLFAPLIIEGTTVGIMGLANKPGDFTDYDADMASAIAEFASIALHNSRTLDALRTTVGDLQKALAEVRTLRGIIPICAKCKKVRNDQGYWSQVDEYIRQHTDASFSHGLCPTCYTESMEEFERDM
jgi:GAF domain-containing protein